MWITTMWVGADAVLVGGRDVPDDDADVDRAMIARWDGRVWTRWTLDARTIGTVDGHRGDCWAAATDGQIWTLDHGAWRKVTRLTEDAHMAIAADGDVWVASRFDIAHRGPGDGRGPWLEAARPDRGLIIAIDASDDGTVAALSSPHGVDADRIEIWDRDQQRFVANAATVPFAREVMAVRARDDIVVGNDAMGVDDAVVRWDGARWTMILDPDDRLDVRDIAYRGRDVVIVARAWGPNYWTQTGLRIIGERENSWIPLESDKRDLRMAGPSVIAIGPDQSMWVADGKQGTVWFRRP